MIKQENMAFVFIGCGPYARTYKCELAIESLIKVAGWKGKVYLVTDSPECFDIEKLKSDCESDNVHLVAVPKFSNKWDWPLGMGGKFPFIKPVPAQTVVESKILKASVFEVVDDPSVEVMLYSDSDVLFPRKDLMATVESMAADWEDKPGIKLRIKDHTWKESNEDPHSLHTGFMIAHRKHSKSILEAWKQRMMDPKEWYKDPYDRTKFLSAFNEVKEKEEEVKFYPLPDTIEKVYNFKGDPSFTAHITIARILKNEFHKVEDFVNQFNLKSAPQGYYSLPGLSKTRRFLFYLGYIPYKKTFKIEDWWKKKREGN
ncbi:MAG: hypothetical protein NXI20_27325 [bacterium]|nr:hypothetical protein [bacterium]